MFQAVLFDLDGTLLNTLEDIADSANAVLTRLQFPTHPVLDYRYFIGGGAAELMSNALPEGVRKDKKLIQTCLEEFFVEYEEKWNSKTCLYPGISALLDRLTCEGWRLSILSNKPQDFTLRCVKEFLSHWIFEWVVGQQQGLPMKPSPEGAFRISRQMKLAPSEFLYLGDSEVDMQTARACGMFPVGVLWGFRSAQELQKHGSQVLLQTPEDFWKIPRY